MISSFARPARAMEARVCVARASSTQGARESRRRRARRSEARRSRGPRAGAGRVDDDDDGVSGRWRPWTSPRARVIARSTSGAMLTSQSPRERARANESVDAFDGRLEPLFYGRGRCGRSVVGRASRFSAVWFGVLGAAQALFRVVLTPTLPNLFESIADGVVLTLIVAPAAHGLAPPRRSVGARSGWG